MGAFVALFGLGLMLTAFYSGGDGDDDTVDPVEPPEVDDRIDVAGTGGEDIIDLTEAGIWVDSFAGDDTITGAASPLNDADSTIRAGSGDDLVTVAESALIEGGLGDDTITTSGDGIVRGGLGDDEISGSNVNAVPGAPLGVVNAGEGDDTVAVFGDMLVRGGEGDDELDLGYSSTGYGQAGDDTLTGSNDSTLFGGAGDDVLLAQVPTSQLDPDAANGRGDGAELTGGDGSDQFLIVPQLPVPGPDAVGVENLVATVTDFDGAEDTLVYYLDSGAEITNLEIRDTADGMGTEFVITSEIPESTDVAPVPYLAVVRVEGVTGLTADDISIIRGGPAL